jgi:hypothetical protein
MNVPEGKKTTIRRNLIMTEEKINDKMTKLTCNQIYGQFKSTYLNL